MKYRVRVKYSGCAVPDEIPFNGIEFAIEKAKEFSALSVVRWVEIIMPDGREIPASLLIKQGKPIIG